jgi:hypothetical protein
MGLRLVVPGLQHEQKAAPLEFRFYLLGDY